MGEMALLMCLNGRVLGRQLFVTPRVKLVVQVLGKMKMRRPRIQNMAVRASSEFAVSFYLCVRFSAGYFSD